MAITDAQLFRRDSHFQTQGPTTMKFIGLLKDYNPQAQYKTMNDGRHERLIAGFTHTFSSRDLIELIERALAAGAIQPEDLPLNPVDLIKAAESKANTSPVYLRKVDDYINTMRIPAPSGSFKVVIDGDHLPARNYTTLEAARGAALVSAQRNGKPTMVVTEHARFTIKKEIVEEN